MQFIDFNGATVTLTFEEHAFGREPDHVFVICKFEGKWLLTEHKKRGWEFPGGKREKGETLEQAATREVFEETGGVVASLCFVGEYEVKENNASFIKRIYFAEIKTLEVRGHFFETKGPVLVNEDIMDERFKDHYSFIMKDDVVRLSLQKVETAEHL